MIMPALSGLSESEPNAHTIYDRTKIILPQDMKANIFTLDHSFGRLIPGHSMPSDRPLLIRSSFSPFVRFSTVLLFGRRNYSNLSEYFQTRPK